MGDAHTGSGSREYPKGRLLKPNVKIGDEVLRRDGNGGELDTWETCYVNETYLRLINEFPDDYRNLDGSHLQMLVVGKLNPILVTPITDSTGKN